MKAVIFTLFCLVLLAARITVIEPVTIESWSRLACVISQTDRVKEITPVFDGIQPDFLYIYENGGDRDTYITALPGYRTQNSPFVAKRMEFEFSVSEDLASLSKLCPN